MPLPMCTVWWRRRGSYRELRRVGLIRAAISRRARRKTETQNDVLRRKERDLRFRRLNEPGFASSIRCGAEAWKKGGTRGGRHDARNASLHHCAADVREARHGGDRPCGQERAGQREKGRC